ncbi:MAG: V-type ATP synthase subunit F [Clostridia bacterium]
MAEIIGKMGVVGERDVVLAFKAMGMRVIPTITPEETTSAVFHLAQEGVPVIFITESAARKVPETLERYRNSPTTAIIPIPGSQGSDGFGMQRVRANVEKAIGADILFEKEG